MENKKINVAKLLKDCPSGMELDCTMYEGVVTFVKIDEYSNYPIVISVQHNGDITICQLTQTGQPCISSYTKCVIFPKGKTTWEGFVPPCQFKDGDKISHCERGGKKLTLYGTKELDYGTPIENQDEYELVPDEIKPKFKVGDRIKHKVTGSIYTVIFVQPNEYDVAVTNEIGKSISIEAQDIYELLPNKFDISTLVPFESKVLIRDKITEEWRPAIWGFYNDNSVAAYPYRILGGNLFSMCIPFEGNEHLLGKTDDCGEYYKTW